MICDEIFHWHTVDSSVLPLFAERHCSVHLNCDVAHEYFKIRISMNQLIKIKMGQSSGDKRNKWAYNKQIVYLLPEINTNYTD